MWLPSELRHINLRGRHVGENQKPYCNGLHQHGLLHRTVVTGGEPVVSKDLENRGTYLKNGGGPLLDGWRLHQRIWAGFGKVGVPRITTLCLTWIDVHHLIPLL